MKKKISLIALVLFGSLFVFGTILVASNNGRSSMTFNSSSTGAERAKAEVADLINAIDAYHTSHGVYPASLDVLVEEKLLERIRPPSYGHPKWIYYQGGKSGECSIGFGTSDEYPACHFSFARREWHVDR